MLRSDCSAWVQLANGGTPHSVCMRSLNPIGETTPHPILRTPQKCSTKLPAGFGCTRPPHAQAPRSAAAAVGPTPCVALWKMCCSSGWGLFPVRKQPKMKQQVQSAVVERASKRISKCCTSKLCQLLVQRVLVTCKLHAKNWPWQNHGPVPVDCTHPLQGSLTERSTTCQPAWQVASTVSTMARVPHCKDRGPHVSKRWAYSRYMDIHMHSIYGPTLLQIPAAGSVSKTCCTIDVDVCLF